MCACITFPLHLNNRRKSFTNAAFLLRILARASWYCALLSFFAMQLTTTLRLILDIFGHDRYKFNNLTLFLTSTFMKQMIAHSVKDTGPPVVSIQCVLGPVQKLPKLLVRTHASRHVHVTRLARVAILAVTVMHSAAFFLVCHR